MAIVLHLLKADAAPIAASVIERNCGEPGVEVTVVLLHGAPPPPLPAGVRIRRLGEPGLDYSSLLDLIFDSDRVIAW